MKRLISIATVLMMASTPLAAQGHDHDAHAGHAAKGQAGPQSMVMTGEILDMNCYMTHEGQGEKHAKCAKACALKGAPLGLLDDQGSVHLLVADHANEKPMKRAQELAGEKVKIAGKMSAKGGLSAIVLSSVEKGK